LVTETFKTDPDTYEILHDDELLKPFNGEKSKLIKAAIKDYAISARNKQQQVPKREPKTHILRLPI